MLVPVLIGCGLSFLTIGIHTFGSAVGIRILRRFSQVFDPNAMSPSGATEVSTEDPFSRTAAPSDANDRPIVPLRFSRLVATLGFTGIYLLVLHFIESIAWAAAYMWLPQIDEIDNWSDAIYFSIVTFASLGYGDLVIESRFRILSGFEAMNGLLIFGWSTAIFMAILQPIWKQYESLKK